MLKPDNNVAENAIRPFVVGRKNWLFAGHPNGAYDSATFFSLIETAKANGMEQGESMAMYLRSNVVSIEAAPQGKPARHGLGFIIGEQGKGYVILTADHVVRSHGPEDDGTRISVTYFNHNDTPYPAQLDTRHDEDYDLAVIHAGKPASHQWKKRTLTDTYDIKRSEKVWFVGRDNEWYVPTDFSKIHEVGLHRLSIEKLSARKGSSGAP